MPCAADVGRDAARKADRIARPAPRTPYDIVLGGNHGGRVAGAVVEEWRPVRAALNREPLGVQPHVLATGDPVIGSQRVRFERCDEARERIAWIDVAYRSDIAVRTAARLGHFHREEDILL